MACVALCPVSVLTTAVLQSLCHVAILRLAAGGAGIGLASLLLQDLQTGALDCKLWLLC